MEHFVKCEIKMILVNDMTLSLGLEFRSLGKEMPESLKKLVKKGENSLIIRKTVHIADILSRL